MERFSPSLMSIPRSRCGLSLRSCRLSGITHGEHGGVESISFAILAEGHHFEPDGGQELVELVLTLGIEGPSLGIRFPAAGVLALAVFPDLEGEVDENCCGRFYWHRLDWIETFCHTSVW